jgi:hypothetical protein
MRLYYLAAISLSYDALNLTIGRKGSPIRTVIKRQNIALPDFSFRVPVQTAHRFNACLPILSFQF